jgi:hypothetical protein
MVVPRTPRPPIVAPKPAERALDVNEVERWVGRLARSIRLKRVEQRYLGGGKPGEAEASAACVADHGATGAS